MHKGGLVDNGKGLVLLGEEGIKELADKVVRQPHHAPVVPAIANGSLGGTSAVSIVGWGETVGCPRGRPVALDYDWRMRGASQRRVGYGLGSIVAV